MNGDFATSMVMGTLLARNSLRDQDNVARIGLTAALVPMPFSLLVAKGMIDNAAAQEGRDAAVATAASAPGAPSPPPAAPPPTARSPAAPAAAHSANPPAESQAVLGELQKHAAALGKAGESLKGVTGDLRLASKSLAASSARLETAAKTLVSQKAV